MPSRTKQGGRINGPHHRGTFPKASAWIRAQAYANPNTRCWRCFLTLPEAKAKWGQQVKWTAGHLIAGQVDGELAAECSHCNFGDSARRLNASRTNRTDLTW